MTQLNSCLLALLAAKMAEEVSEFKIAVIGEQGVGKSSIVSSFSSDDEEDATEGQFINILFFIKFFVRLYFFSHLGVAIDVCRCYLFYLCSLSFR